MSVYADAPVILNWEDNRCRHPRIMFNKCWVCYEEFEGFNKELFDSYLKSAGYNQEQIDILRGDSN